MCSLQISVLFVLIRVEISLFSSGMLGCCGVFLLVQFLLSYFVANVLRQESVCVANPTYWNVFLSCLVEYVGECLACVMHVCRWL